jgi:LuxR family maltose regulon positive regulatory protein
MHPWTQASPTALASRAVLIHPRIRLARVGQLTDRERDVLDQLPSRRNLDEIADDLAVPVSTVTSDLRSIYGKLGVSSRRTAVLAARQRALLRQRL